MKRLLSLLLCLVMLVSLMPGMAFADEEPTEITVTEEAPADEGLTETEETPADGEEPSGEEPAADDGTPSEETPADEEPSGEVPAEAEPAEEEPSGSEDGETPDENGEDPAAADEEDTDDDAEYRRVYPVHIEIGAGTEMDPDQVSETLAEIAAAEAGEEIDEQLSYISASVSWTTPCAGSPMCFTVKPKDGGDYTYCIYFIKDEENIVAYGPNSTLSTMWAKDGSNSMYFTFMTSGTYYIRFALFENGSSSASYVTSTYTVKISDPNYPSVSSIVSDIAAQCTAQCSTDVDRAIWLHDWLYENSDYDYTYTYYGAEAVLTRGTGVCQSYMFAYSKLLTAVGISNSTLRSSSHGWNCVQLNGVWCEIDVTWDSCNKTDNSWKRYIYYGLTDELMTLGHKASPLSIDHECTSLAANYFVTTGKITAWTDPLADEIQSNVNAGKTSFTITVDRTRIPSDYYLGNNFYDSVIYSAAAFYLTGTGVMQSGGEQIAVLSAEYSGSDVLTFSAEYVSVLSAPVITGAYNYADYIKVVWNAVDGAESYRLFYRKGTEDWVKVCDTTSTRVNITDVEDGAAYTFMVACVSANGRIMMSPYSNRASQIRLLTPTATVTRIGKAGTVDGSGFKVSWNATTGGSCYKIYYREKGGSWALYANYAKSNNTRFVNIKSSVTNASTAAGKKFPDLVIGHTYEFVVLTATSQAGITSGFPTSYTGYKF